MAAAERLTLPRLPRETIALVVAFNVIVLTGVVVVARSTATLALVVVAVVLNAAYLSVARRRLSRPLDQQAPLTGNVLSSAHQPPPEPSTDRSWTGSALLPTAIGRIRASPPLAVLELRQGAVSVRLQPRLAGLMMAYRPPTLRPDDLLAVGPTTNGLALYPPSMPPTVFVTPRFAEILRALGEQGFPVDPRVRRIKRF